MLETVYKAGVRVTAPQAGELEFRDDEWPGSGRDAKKEDRSSDWMRKRSLRSRTKRRKCAPGLRSR